MASVDSDPNPNRDDQDEHAATYISLAVKILTPPDAEPLARHQALYTPQSTGGFVGQAALVPVHVSAKSHGPVET